jgi:bifunctional non-homologous end joining protein LigD
MLGQLSPQMGKRGLLAHVGTTTRPPKWIKPQLTRLVEEAPAGDGWLHEIKFDGYRMHARIEGAQAKLLTRTGLDWSHRYSRTIDALRSLNVKSAYIDGELCALNADGVPVFSQLQAAMDEGRTDQLVFFAFDLLFLNGESMAQLPLTKRKEGLQRLFKKEVNGLRYTDHVAGNGPQFRAQACKLGLEGAVSKRADQPYAPGDRGIWLKSKCLNREEFVVVGWTDPEGSRSHIGALLLGYYTEDGQLHYAGRAGTGINDKELRRLAGVLKPLAVPKMPLAVPPPRDSRFGSPLKLSKVHWVKPELVVEVTYLTWTEDNLLRQVSYQAQREDKPARQVVRPVPNAPRCA